MNKATELHTLSNLYGHYEIKSILGDYKSYLYLRKKYTFNEINNEIKQLLINL
jgi:hypothetical protein